MGRCPLPPSPPLQISSSPTEESNPAEPRAPPPPPPLVVVIGASPFISAPFFDQHHPQFEAVSVSNPKRPRFGVSQWKLLTSPLESSPSPTTHPNPNPLALATTASSSDMTSLPIQSPKTYVPTTSCQETSKLEGGGDQQQFQTHHQFRKGENVSPVWKPNEMLWLARAWWVQYQRGGGGGSPSDSRIDHNPLASGGDAAAPRRGKMRVEKDKEAAEFLNQHRVNRDAKTAGTKWDNMLGE